MFLLLIYILTFSQIVAQPYYMTPETKAKANIIRKPYHEMNSLNYPGGYYSVDFPNLEISVYPGSLNKMKTFFDISSKQTLDQRVSQWQSSLGSEEYTFVGGAFSPSFIYRNFLLKPIIKESYAQWQEGGIIVSQHPKNQGGIFLGSWEGKEYLFWTEVYGFLDASYGIDTYAEFVWTPWEGMKRPLPTTFYLGLGVFSILDKKNPLLVAPTLSVSLWKSKNFDLRLDNQWRGRFLTAGELRLGPSTHPILSLMAGYDKDVTLGFILNAFLFDIFFSYSKEVGGFKVASVNISLNLKE